MILELRKAHNEGDEENGANAQDTEGGGAEMEQDMNEERKDIFAKSSRLNAIVNAANFLTTNVPEMKAEMVDIVKFEFQEFSGYVSSVIFCPTMSPDDILLLSEMCFCIQEVSFQNPYATRLYNSYSNLYVQAENASYAGNFVIANWSKMAKTETNPNKKQIIIRKINEFKEFITTSKKKAAEAQENMEEMRTIYNFEEPVVSYL